MTLEIRIVSSAAELEAVQRQRYAVYVRELGYSLGHADHSEGTVAEALDATGYIFGAFCARRLVGSVRINYGEDGDFAEYASLYPIHRFAPYLPSQLAIDLEHFAKIRSPISRVCPRHDEASVDLFRRRFAAELDRYSAPP
jgi:hypothetical protein